MPHITCFWRTTFPARLFISVSSDLTLPGQKGSSWIALWRWRASLLSMNALDKGQNINFSMKSIFLVFPQNIEKYVRWAHFFFMKKIFNEHFICSFDHISVRLWSSDVPQSIHWELMVLNKWWFWKLSDNAQLCAHDNDVVFPPKTSWRRRKLLLDVTGLYSIADQSSFLGFRFWILKA